jgi:hypothetical protein
LANLSALTVYVTFLRNWQTAGAFGNWSVSTSLAALLRIADNQFSVISGVLPSVVSALFGYFLPIILRRISKYQGAPTRSRLDRAVSARYFFFIILSNLVIFSLLGVIYSSIAAVVAQIGERQSAGNILQGLRDIPDRELTSDVEGGKRGLTGRYPRHICATVDLLVDVVAVSAIPRLCKSSQLTPQVARFPGHFRNHPAHQARARLAQAIHVFAHAPRDPRHDQAGQL